MSLFTFSGSGGPRKVAKEVKLVGGLCVISPNIFYPHSPGHDVDLWDRLHVFWCFVSKLPNYCLQVCFVACSWHRALAVGKNIDYSTVQKRAPVHHYLFVEMMMIVSLNNCHTTFVAFIKI